MAAVGTWPVTSAWAHHGWSSFDQSRPLYLEGAASRVSWRNPHAELILQLDASPKLPTDLASRAVPPQVASVDVPGLLKAARLPTRPDKRWEIELAPLSRMSAWNVPELKSGDRLGVLGFTFAGEKGEAILRAEVLFLGEKAYGLRSAPA
jgi:hypothetical protein